MLAALTIGCGRDVERVTAPSALGGLPGATGTSGTWSGTLTGDPAGVRYLSITMLERSVLGGTGAVVSGSWRLSDGPNVGMDSGTLRGTLLDGELMVVLEPAVVRECPPAGPLGPQRADVWNLHLRVSSARLSGTYSLASCQTIGTGIVGAVGIVELARQP